MSQLTLHGTLPCTCGAQKVIECVHEKLLRVYRELGGEHPGKRPSGCLDQPQQRPWPKGY